jgi:hypothetical protein
MCLNSLWRDLFAVLQICSFACMEHQLIGQMNDAVRSLPMGEQIPRLGASENWGHSSFRCWNHVLSSHSGFFIRWQRICPCAPESAWLA